MLELDKLTRRFGERVAVADVTLAIPGGQMVGVIGRSGAGKSTLLRMVNRLLDPSEGRVRFEGRDITRLRGSALHAWRASAAMIFQQFNLVPRLDVLTNVLAGRLNHIPTARALFMLFTARERALAIRALDRLDIADLALNRADALSGGQQQRVAIARALMQEPRLLLADEPIASLDPMNAKLVMDALRDINRRDGITVLCNLHTLDTARAYCDRIVGMAQGRIVFDGAPETLDEAAVRSIYGAADHEQSLDERITSTSLAGARRRCLRAPDNPTGENNSMLRRVCLAAIAACAFGLAAAHANVPTRPRSSASACWAARTRRTGWRATTSSSSCCEQKLGIPVKLFPAADYAGVMQGIAAGQLEMAEFGASGFAGAWLDCKCVEPIVVPQENGWFHLLLLGHGRARGFGHQDAGRHEGSFARVGRSELDVRLSDPECHAEGEGHQAG